MSFLHLRPFLPRSGHALALLALLLCGCGKRYLVDTPNLLHHQDPQITFAGCPEDCRTPAMEVLYATDRARVEGDSKTLYGSGRASHLAFGLAKMELSPNLPWQDLVNDSTRPKRSQDYVLQLADCSEKGRFEILGPHRSIEEQGLSLVSTPREKGGPDDLALHELLQGRLAKTQHKDVFVFIHGFNNSFEDAVFRAGEVWHFMGRVGVPITYTWPAGRGGLFGYAYDRESGEFTVTHLKKFLRSLAACPEVERIHLIAHSRGTDVAISALRELHIGYQAQGQLTRQALKLENLILAAPDLDEDVFVQRFVAEGLLGAAGRTTIYASRHDRALEAADMIFGSRKRLGALGPRDFSPRVRKALARLPQLQFIECRTTGYALNHDYVFANPGALSDLILVLRDRRAPGAENGRPLGQPIEGVWELSASYPHPNP
jgi:esterase/lipase superfamily enzyme